MIRGEMCDEPAVWNEIVFDLEGHPMQLWGWGALQEKNGWRVHRVICIDDSDDTVVGGAQILVQPLVIPFRRHCYIPRGPVWHEDKAPEVLEAIVSYVKQHLPGVALTIDPDDEAIEVGEEWVATESHHLNPKTIILDLDRGESTLRSEMSDIARNYTMSTARDKLVIRRIRRPDEISSCFDVTDMNEKDRTYYKNVHNLLGESSVVFGAYQHDRLVAVLWLVMSTKTALELWLGVREQGRACHAEYVLRWHVIRTCREWGVDRYDMNGLGDDNVGDSKRHFAKTETMMAGAYQYPLSSSYTLWKNVSRKLKRLRLY